MSSSLKLPVLLALGVALLVGCDRLDRLMLDQMEQNVVLASEPMLLQPQPVTFRPDPALQVRGESSELCFALADGVPAAGNYDVDARERELLHGAKINALLHDKQGKTYAWTCGGWMLEEQNREVGRLYTCATQECNRAKPPKGTEFVSVDVSATTAVRVLAVTWSSTDAFDHVEKH
jgi:hypothetical protein